MRMRLFLVSLTLVLAGAFGSHASLSRFDVRTTSLLEYSATSPKLRILFPLLNVSEGSVAHVSPGRVVINNDGGSGSPVLVK